MNISSNILTYDVINIHIYFLFYIFTDTYVINFTSNV